MPVRVAKCVARAGALAAACLCLAAPAAAQVFTSFALPAGSQPFAITAGPDGAIWFTENGTNKIGRLSVDGSQFNDVATPTPLARPEGIAPGPDGALWFTESSASNRIGRITTAGAITEFTTPTSGSQPLDITAGPDGAMWFTEYSGNRIGRITVPIAQVGAQGAPALSPWGVLLLAALLAAAGAFGLRRRHA
jgi:virginiamycin B lyase